MTSGPRALAFLACPPAHFGRLAGHLRAAAPDAAWDFVCFYPPPEDPGAGVRVLRPVGRLRFALALVLGALRSPYRSVWIAVEDLRRTDAVVPLVGLSLLLRAGARRLIDRAGASRPLASAWTEPAALVTAGALLPVARAVTALGLALAPPRQPAPRRGRTALVIPILPDLSHTAQEGLPALRQADPAGVEHLPVLREGLRRARLDGAPGRQGRRSDRSEGLARPRGLDRGPVGAPVGRSLDRTAHCRVADRRIAEHDVWCDRCCLAVVGRVGVPARAAVGRLHR